MSLLKHIIFAITVFAGASHAHAIDWIGFGDLRGSIEPCGCDPATDLGGVKRLSNFVQIKRASHPNALILGLGNLVSAEPQIAKDDHILRAIEIIQADAILFNSTELNSLAKNVLPRTSAPFVLSNGRQELAAATRFAYIVERANVAIWGYTYHPAVQKHVRRLDGTMINGWKKQMESIRKPGVLLFSGSDAELAQIANAKIFQVIVSANSAPLTALPGTQEKDSPGKLLRSREHAIYMTPLGGQGVILGGALQATPLSSPLPDKGATSSSWFANAPHIVSWLDTELERPSLVDKILASFAESSNDEFLNWTRDRERLTGNSSFIGPDACEICHKSAYDIWRSSKHAQAMEPLRAKQRDKQLECVSCHVTGLKELGGFVSVERTPHLSSVTCETCHGSRLEHTKNPKIRGKAVPGELCQTCHHSPHSSAFKFSNYWPKIAHGK